MSKCYGLLLGLMFAGAASALDFEFDNGINIALDSTVTYGAQWRMQNQDSELSSRGLLARLQEDPLGTVLDRDYVAQQALILNGDDGNNNFDTGLVSQRVSALVDMDMSWRNYGFFARGRAFYDQVYRDDDTNLDEIDFATYNSGTLYGGDASRGEFPRQTKNDHGDRLEVLDAYVYGTWELPGDRLMDVRLGRQVINWGESTFYQGINSIQNRADQIAANTPGVEVKEILLPTGAAYVQVDVVTNLTLEVFYQYEWLENELNGVGSYFGNKDQVGPGAANFLIPSPNLPFVPENVRGNEFNLREVPRGSDDNASDSGQWGAGFHYVTPNNWDVGLFFINGHDKKPSLQLDYIDVPGSPEPFPVAYRLKYFEDIKGSAVSFTGVLGETNVQGELSFLDGTPMANAAGDPERQDLLKFQLGGSHVFGPSFLADDTVLTFEGFYADVTSANSNDLIADNSAYGYSFLAEFSYNNVAQGWDMKVPIYMKHDVDGVVQELQVFEDAKVVSLGLRGIYLNNLTLDLAYAFYWDGGLDHLIKDRDHLSVTAKYSF